MQIFFLLVFIAAIVIILFIIFRKLPQLTVLNVETLPHEIEARTKKQILLKRMEAEGKEMQARWKARLTPIKFWWSRGQAAFRRYVGRIERLWDHEKTTKERKPIFKPVQTPAAVEKLDELILAAEQALAKKQFERAEELFIAAIKINKKLAPAYRGLATTYFEKGALEEAKQTYEFLLQLEPSSDQTCVQLSNIAEMQGDTMAAIQYLEQAVVLNDALSPRFYHLGELLLKVDQPATALEAVRSAIALEPKNPKYLDLLLETAILVNDKDLASETFSELRLANPDNQKLGGFKERIEKLA